MGVPKIQVTFKGVRAERGELVLGQVQVDQPLHAVKGPSLHLHDLAALKVQRHDLAESREAVGGDVMEVVSTQVKKTRG